MHYLQLLWTCASPRKNAPPSAHQKQPKKFIHQCRRIFSLIFLIPQIFHPVVRHLPIHCPRKTADSPRFLRDLSHIFFIVSRYTTLANQIIKKNIFDCFSCSCTILHCIRGSFWFWGFDLHTEKLRKEERRTHHCVADVWVDSWRASMTFQMKCPMASID